MKDRIINTLTENKLTFFYKNKLYKNLKDSTNFTVNDVAHLLNRLVDIIYFEKIYLNN